MTTAMASSRKFEWGSAPALFVAQGDVTCVTPPAYSGARVGMPDCGHQMHLIRAPRLSAATSGLRLGGLRLVQSIIQDECETHPRLGELLGSRLERIVL